MLIMLKQTLNRVQGYGLDAAGSGKRPEMASVESYRPLPSRTNRKLGVTSSLLRTSLFHGASKKSQPRRALETEHNSLWELNKGTLEGGLLYWGPQLAIFGYPD
jgi:hypothetical protein